MKRSRSGGVRAAPGEHAISTLSVDEQFKDFGGSPAFLKFIAKCYPSWRESHFGPMLSKHRTRDLKIESLKLRATLGALLDDTLKPHFQRHHAAAKLLKVPIESSAIRPYCEALEFIDSLNGFQERVEQWGRHEEGALFGRRRDAERLFWIGILAPYTALLTGRPKWEWITAWMREKLNLTPRKWKKHATEAPGSYSFHFWWRDKNAAIKKLPDELDQYREINGLICPALLYLRWLAENKSLTPRERKTTGRKYIEALIEICWAIPTIMHPVLRMRAETPVAGWPLGFVKLAFERKALRRQKRG